MPEPVSIIGASGALGFGLAVRLARAGGEVVIGSRDVVRAEEAVERARELVPEGVFSGARNDDAAAASELVILCVPFRNQSETLHNLRDILRPGQLVVDTTVPLAAAVGGKATRTLGVWQGSAAQQAQEMVPDGVNVVSALHTISAKSLRELGSPLDEDVLLAGDVRAVDLDVVGGVGDHRQIPTDHVEHPARELRAAGPAREHHDVRHQPIAAGFGHSSSGRPVIFTPACVL